MLIIVLHQSPLRTVAEEEVLRSLSSELQREPRRIFEIDERDCAEAIASGQWRAAHSFIRSRVAELRRLVQENPGAKVIYFGLGEVPLLIAVGAYLGDEVIVEVRDLDRDTGQWVWSEEGATLDLLTQGIPIEKVDAPGTALVRIELSYPINDSFVDDAVGKGHLADIGLSIASPPGPRPGAVRTLSHVEAIRAKMRDIVVTLANQRPLLEKIHLFVAAPPSVCIAVGRELRLRNSVAVQTYRHRSTTDDAPIRPALLLSAGSATRAEIPLSNEEIREAGELRVVLRNVLRQVADRVAELREAGPGTGMWYDILRPASVLADCRPFPTLPPITELVEEGDQVSEEPRNEAYAFDKDPIRQWRASDRLLLDFKRAVSGNEQLLEALMRLFLYHEYLHDWQDLTKYTADDVGSFANALERIDYMADAYAIIHQLDFALARGALDERDEGQLQRYLVEQIGLVLRSFWAFEELPPPNHVWQERRLRRYLNWFWRRVQIRAASGLRQGLRLLGVPPVVEIAGLRYSTDRGRIFVTLNEVRRGDTLEIGVVLDDGIFDRRGSTTDMSIEELLEAFANHDHGAVELFFNSFYEHERARTRRPLS